MKLIDRTGERHTRLVVVSRAPNKSETDTNARWNCVCDCGKEVIAYGQDLKRGKVKSCGCLNAERIKTHGASRSPVYKVWQQMFQRCENPNCDAYRNYGARGIRVDDRWKSFETFIADMGIPAKGLTIERKDNNGNYSKDNCEWVPMKVQGSNKRNNVHLTYEGVTLTLSQWAERTGINYTTIKARLGRGWAVEEILGGELISNEARARQYDAFGKTQTLTEWCNEYGLNREMVRGRLRNNMSLEEALTTRKGES